MDETSSLDLKEYYRTIRKCKKCGVMFGTDNRKDNNPYICPNCETKLEQEKRRRK